MRWRIRSTATGPLGEEKELSGRVRAETASEKCLIPQCAPLVSGQGFQIASFKRA